MHSRVSETFHAASQVPLFFLSVIFVRYIDTCVQNLSVLCQADVTGGEVSIGHLTVASACVLSFAVTLIVPPSIYQLIWTIVSNV